MGDQLKKRGIFIVLSGFAGSGKGTLVKGLVSKYKEDYSLSISMTTRTPRPGEVENGAYFFVSRESFEEQIQKGGLVEYAEYLNNYYGTPKDFVETKLSEGYDVILEIEVQGASKVKDKYPDSILVFVSPPSLEELERRLMGRGTETPEQVKGRLTRARQEVNEIIHYDYILINDDVDTAVEKLHRIIRSAHCTPERNAGFIEGFKKQLEDKY